MTNSYFHLNSTYKSWRENKSREKQVPRLEANSDPNPSWSRRKSKQAAKLSQDFLKQRRFRLTSAIVACPTSLFKNVLSLETVKSTSACSNPHFKQIKKSYRKTRRNPEIYWICTFLSENGFFPLSGAVTISRATLGGGFYCTRRHFYTLQAITRGLCKWSTCNARQFAFEMTCLTLPHSCFDCQLFFCRTLCFGLFELV